MVLPKPISGKWMYYIETINAFPFRGAGWYSQPIVQYSIKNELVAMREIKMEFLPSYILPANHYHKHIKTSLDAFAIEPDLMKASVNSFVGLLGKTKRTATKIKFTQSIENSSLWCSNRNPKTNIFIQNVKLDNNEVLYKGIFSEDVKVEEMKYPIYK